MDDDDDNNNVVNANKALKKCWWELTKARQMKSSKMIPIDVPFTASNVREEFNAKIRLDITVPDLVLNDDDADTVVSAPPTFVILDAVEEYKKSRQNDNNENDNKKMSTPTKTPTAASSSSDTGLRQRKGDSNNDNNSSDGDSGWVVVDNDTNENQAMIMKELNIVEPIELIAGGLPPKELKLAQKQAQKALQEYINIANKATILLSTLQKQQQAEAQ